jgi:hypothetical protein
VKSRRNVASGYTVLFEPLGNLGNPQKPVLVKIVFLKTLMVGFMHGVQIVSNDSVLTETVVRFFGQRCYLGITLMTMSGVA